MSKLIEPDFWAGKGRYSKLAIRRAGREAREALKANREVMDGRDVVGGGADTGPNNAGALIPASVDESPAR